MKYNPEIHHRRSMRLKGYDCSVSSTIGPKNKFIGALVAGFKSAVTIQINKMRGMLGYPVWQRNYHEHIIRNDQSLEKIREYVIHNPETWKKDTLFSH